MLIVFFFFHETAPPDIYTLSLHDALPIFCDQPLFARFFPAHVIQHLVLKDRKSTRLNSSHVSISYAVFCLKKKIEFQEGWHYRKRRFMRVSGCEGFIGG